LTLFQIQKANFAYLTKNKNSLGICAFSPREENSYLAFPGSSERGDIVIFDALVLQTLTGIHAHKTPLSKLSINQNGTLLASSSTKVKLKTITNLIVNIGNRNTCIFTYRIYG
jgi:autophagy-related protein 18